MLKNAYLLAKIGADTAENDRFFAENLPKIGNDPTGRLPYYPVPAALRLAVRAVAGVRVASTVPGAQVSLVYHLSNH